VIKPIQLGLQFKVCLLLAVFAIAVASTLSAQTFVGQVRGLVQDPGGAVIVNATVTITNVATNVADNARSNGAGEYSFPQLDPATYTITVEAQGFKKLNRANVIVGTAETVGVDLKMEIGQVSESVSVTTEVPLIENTNASNGQVLDQQKVQDLPILGRNVLLLSKLATNTAPVGDPRFNRFQDQNASSQVSVGGGPIRGNNYLIDGVPVTDSSNRSVIIPLEEGVQEMKLQTGTYDATMGRTGGGVFNTVLRTGTNDFHGDLLGYIRPNDLMANTFFNNATGQPKIATTFKNFAGSAGGPIYVPRIYDGKNKTFFFVAQEAYRQHTPLTNNFALPTALEKTGNFSRSSNSSGQPLIIYDPSTGFNGATRTPFAGNIIPLCPAGAATVGEGCVTQLGSNLINVLPNRQKASPTDGLNYTGSDSLYDRADEYMYKVEHSVTAWFRLTGSFLYYKSREPGGNPLGIPEGGSATSSSYLLYRRVDATQLNAILTANPTTVVAVRYGFNRFPNFTEGIALANASSSLGSGAPNLQALGFPANYISQVPANYYPNIIMGNSNVNISNQSLVPSNFYSKNLLGNVSRYVGRHSLSMGIDYRVINSGPTVIRNAGVYTFNGEFSRVSGTTSSTATGADFADLLMGYPSSGTANTAVPLNTYVRYYGGYVQDNIRVNPKLTVNLGVRYEYETGEAEVDGHQATNFNQGAINPIAAGLPAGSGVIPYGVIGFAGINGNPTACCSPSHTKFGPRAGAAYQLDSKTTLRGGIGIFYAPTVFSYGDSSPGYTQSNNYVASQDGGQTPAHILTNPFPAGIPQPSGNTLSALTSLGNGFSFLDPAKSGGGTVYQYSFDIQREIYGGIALEAGYFGARANGLSPAPGGTGGTLPINQASPAVLSQYTMAQLNTKVANPFFGLPGANGVIGLSTVSKAQLLLPFPEYSGGSSGILENTTLAKSRYNSLLFKAQKRFSHGLTFLSTFTWSRSEDNEYSSGGNNAFNVFSGSGGGIQNVYSLISEWALAAANTPLKFTLGWTYRLPLGKGKPPLNNNKAADYILGGWAINGTAVIQNGFPIIVVQNNGNSNIGGANQRPNATGISPVCAGGSPEACINDYINAAAFSLAPNDTFGNVARNIPYLGPGMANWDISVFKTVTIKERYAAQFRFEALNAFNTPLFANPSNNLSNSSTFGQLNYQANFPRAIQLGIQLRW